MGLWDIQNIADCPELLDQAAEWFHAKWGIPLEMYRESMEESLGGASVPRWYVALEDKKIIGGLGVIENDFHDRKDLAPNVCAVYVEPERRCRGLAGELLGRVCGDMKERGFEKLYLLTDHTSFYERYGWEFLCMAQGDGEAELSRMYVHSLYMEEHGMWKYEQEAREAGLVPVCGCDEAGAGPLAGPVYAAAVILPFGLEIPGLNDSKQLTEQRREALFPVIQEKAVAWAVARVEAEEIDKTDILSARMKAMQLAMDALGVRPAFALIDGNRDKGKSAAITTPHRCIIKGDSHSASIAAASILAKVSRDRYMVEQDAVYPGYSFAAHKGYGTKAHYAALDALGPCAIHRESFLRKWKEARGQ